MQRRVEAQPFVDHSLKHRFVSGSAPRRPRRLSRIALRPLPIAVDGRLVSGVQQLGRMVVTSSSFAEACAPSASASINRLIEVVAGGAPTALGDHTRGQNPSKSCEAWTPPHPRFRAVDGRTGTWRPCGATSRAFAGPPLRSGAPINSAITATGIGRCEFRDDLGLVAAGGKPSISGCAPTQRSAAPADRSGAKRKRD